MNQFAPGGATSFNTTGAYPCMNGSTSTFSQPSIPVGPCNQFGPVPGYGVGQMPMRGFVPGAFTTPDQFVQAGLVPVQEGLNNLQQAYAASGGMAVNPNLMHRYEQYVNAIVTGEKIMSSNTKLGTFQRDQALDRIRTVIG